MAHELGLVDRNVLDADGALIAINIHNAIDHDERIAMRKQPQDLANLDRIEAFGAHVLPPTDTPGKRALPGTSEMTRLRSATTAPSPIAMSPATEACVPMVTKSPTVTLPAMPVCAAIRQCRPMLTLWAICTRLSILLPSPIIVSRIEPRSMVVF